MTIPIARIPGYENYVATKCGKILSLRFSRIKELRPHIHPKGYKQVALWREKRQKTRWVHDLVLSAFVRPKEVGEVCRHLNGDPSDNSLDNLCWGTSKENSEDMVRHGRCRKSRFGEEDFAEMRDANNPPAEVAEKFGVSRSYISHIRAGRKGVIS